MSTRRIILASLPSFCQMSSKLVKIWRSSDKNNFAQFFWDTVYMKWLELESERIITSQQLPFLEYIETHSEKWIRLFVFMSCFVNFYLFAIGYCNIHYVMLVHLLLSFAVKQNSPHNFLCKPLSAFISHKQPGSSLTIPYQTVPCKLIVLWIADLLGNAVTSHRWWRYWNILNLQKQKWVCRL